MRPWISAFVLSWSIWDINDPGKFLDFAGRNQDCIAQESVHMRERTHLVQFAKGQAFALIDGGQSHEMHIPASWPRRA